VAHPRRRQCEGREEGGVGGGTNRAGTRQGRAGQQQQHVGSELKSRAPFESRQKQFELVRPI
jgi:hypothetical protein